jgi:16S rRNA (guanine966-N2)-methyltransferase
MRIVSGDLRGRRLVVPPGRDVRPTSERARAALFDVLTHRFQADGRFSLAGARVLDAFAGSGALGLEALSRGAGHAVFMDLDPALTRTLERLCADWRLGVTADILRADATRPPPRPAGTDPRTLIFLDPPYGREMAAPALAALAAKNWLAPDALCVVETARTETFAPPSGFTVLDDRAHGRARLRTLQWDPSP